MLSVRSPYVRRVIAGPLAAVSCLLTVALPLVERADVPGAPVVESKHDSAHCGDAHNHRICTQTGANQSAASTRSDAWDLAATDWTSVAPTRRSTQGAPSLRLEPARGPPAA